MFVSGGARSGKSTFAEQLVEQEANSGPLHYIATSKPTDSEMKDRIIHHQDRRTANWKTWEQPTSINELGRKFSDKDCILLDCLTIWTANELFKNGVIQDGRSVYERILHSIQQFNHVHLLVIVSNDLFSDEVPRDEGSFIYMKLLGSLHQEVVRIADCAYQVTHGIPTKMKGSSSLL
ncbi:bifunctional adenosylcobinamide kinase/adenosylcobinamide-phosphate guanylyltransferase [Bacillus sp. AK128]